MGIFGGGTDYEDVDVYNMIRFRRAIKVLGLILNNLPQKRDWLDPDLEKEGKNLVKRLEEK